MDEKEKRKKAHENAFALDYLVGKLRDAAEELTFTKEDCPLRNLKDTDHYRLSQLIADGGYEWNCPFCNEYDST